MSPELTFSRLTADDAQEAAVFLNEVWGSHYGPTGAPIFTTDYLRWLYGGPDSARHLVLACHIAGRLVGIRALLHRSVSFQGRVWAAYLTTHLAIHPDLGRPFRAVASDRILDFSTLLTDTSAGSSTDARDVHVSFYEEGKRELIQKVGRRASEQGIGTSLWPFNQAIVNPVVLQRRVGAGQQAGRRVRPVVDADIPELAQLFARVAAKQPFALTISVDRLRHHILRLPGGRTYLVEDQGVPTAFITFYVMETLSASGPSRMVVVEFLVGDGTPDEMCLLLNEALVFARSSDARGVVMENPTYLDVDTRRFCGIVPSIRRMVAVTRSRIHAFECGDGFLCDVK